MRRCRIWLAMALLLPLYVAAVEAKQELSLQDVAGRALSHNRQLRIQEKELRAAWARVVQANSAYLPHVSVDAGYTHTDAVLPLSLPGKKDSGVYTGYADDNHLGFTVWQNLYNGGATQAQVRSALIGHMSQAEAVRAARLTVEFEAKRLYYGLLLAKETERIAQRLVDQSQQHYQTVQHRFDQGAASQLELLQSKVQVARVMPELVKASSAVQLIKAELKKLMGVSLAEELSVQGTLHVDTMNIDEGEFLQQAYLENPQMIVASLGIDLGKWQIQFSRAAGMPQVNASGGYAYHSSSLGNMVDPRHSNWQAGVSISIPVFDGFSSKGRVDEAKAKYGQALLEKADLVDQIAIDVKQACLDMQQSAAIIASQEQNVESAKEALRIAEKSYENGEATNLDILDAQIALAQIEKNLSEARYGYLMAQAALDRTRARFIDHI